MANVLFNSFKEGCIGKDHDLAADIIKATLIDTADETFAATDTTYVAGANGIIDVSKVAVSPQLTSPTIALGVFDTADFTWATVTGDPCEAIILWNDTTTTPIADALILWMDTGITGMSPSITPNGGNINCTVHASGWFSL